MRTRYVPPKGWMTRSQASHYLGVTEWKWAELVKAYAILARRDRGTHIYKASDVEAIARVYEDSHARE